MNRAIAEALRLTNATLATLQGTPVGAATDAKAQLAYLCGVLSATAAAQLLAADPNAIVGSTYWSGLQACFEQARVAGATYETMDAVRVLVPTFKPLATNLGAMISNFVMRMTLVEQAQILSARAFTSRTEVDSYIDRIMASFGAAIDVAAANMDTGVYVALVKLQSAVVADLTARAAPLPSIVAATFPRPLPALLIAQALFQDPTQVAAIVAMNSVPHPAFMPTSLKVLSSAAA